MKDEENDEEPHEEEKLFLRSYTKYNKQIQTSGHEGRFSCSDRRLRRKVGFYPTEPSWNTATLLLPGQDRKVFLVASRNTIEVDVF